MSGLETREQRRPIRPTRSDTATRLLNLAMSTPARKSRDRLTDTEDAIYRYLLEQFPRLRRAPRRQEIEGHFRLAVSEVERILDAFHALDLVYPDGTTHGIQVAYLFGGPDQTRGALSGYRPRDACRMRH